MNYKKVLVVVACMILVALCCVGAYCLLTDNETPNINVNDGNMIVNNNNEEEFAIGQREALYTEEDFPIVDGSTATIPLSEAFRAEFLGKNLNEVSVTHSKTHYAYENLINGKADLILVTYPSADEFKMAEDNDVELEVIPVVNEAFVFYTNIQNPVKSLTLEQIQKIYTGEITNWSQVGGDDATIKAYQRETNSGSQTGMLKLVMNGLEMMQAKTEDIIGDMASIIGLVSDFDNGKDAIGYSYYYYATTMYDTIDKEIADRIDLLAVNGIEPTNETIKDGTYPIRTNYYIVINAAEPEDGPVRNLVNAMLSERGQKAAEAVG